MVSAFVDNFMWYTKQEVRDNNTAVVRVKDLMWYATQEIKENRVVIHIKCVKDELADRVYQTVCGMISNSVWVKSIPVFLHWNGFLVPIKQGLRMVDAWEQKVLDE